MTTKKRAPAREKNPRFVVYHGGTPGMISKPTWRWRLYARNGEIVASGEGYTTEKDARRGVAAVKRAVLAIVAAEEAALRPKLNMEQIGRGVKILAETLVSVHDAPRSIRRRGRAN